MSLMGPTGLTNEQTATVCNTLKRIAHSYLARPHPACNVLYFEFTQPLTELKSDTEPSRVRYRTRAEIVALADNDEAARNVLDWLTGGADVSTIVVLGLDPRGHCCRVTWHAPTTSPGGAA